MRSANLLFKIFLVPFTRFGFNLVKPHPSVKDSERIRLAQLSAGLALASAFLNIGGFFAVYSLFGLDLKSISLLINVFVALLAYGFSKTKNSSFGGLILVLYPLVNGVIVVAAGTNNPGFSLFTTIPVAFIYASIFLSTKWLVGLTVLVSATTFLMPLVIPDIDVNSVNTAGGQFMQWGVLFIIISVSRNIIERERLADYQKVNKKLQDFQLELEERVERRTIELNLASDLGLVLSQVRELDALLEQSVQLIHDRYALYYVQIYLTDIHNKNLVLQAGFGEVGKQLKQRGHRLSIDVNSLNGQAAYEKRTIIIENTSTSKTFRPNILLPLTQSEMCIPLLVGDRVVGVLDIQSSKPDYFSNEKLPGYNSLAGQLAIAIENTRLLEQAIQSSLELENEAKNRTFEGWQNYLDAIHNHEYLGAVYSNGIVRSTTQKFPPVDEGEILEIPLRISGTTIGAIQVERKEEQMDADGHSRIINAVAEQAARQLENLRLLNQAKQYQFEAETTIKRVTRESWHSFHEETQSGELGYVYDNNKVMPLNSNTKFQESGLTLNESIKINNENIGELVFTGLETMDESTMELVRTVTEQLSIHLENLRLTEQTQRALWETDTLYNIISELNSIKDYNAILQVLSKHTILNNIDQSLVMFIFDKPFSVDKTPEWVIPIAAQLTTENQLAERYPLNAFEVEPNTLFTNSTVVIENIENDPRLDRITRTLFKDVFNAESSVIIPLLIGEQSLGFIMGNFGRPTQFEEKEIQRLSTVASQVAITVQGMRLLEETMARARREQLLREVANQVNNASGTDSILRRAAEQVGKAIKKPVYVYIGENFDQTITNVGENDVGNNGYK